MTPPPRRLPPAIATQAMKSLWEISGIRSDISLRAYRRWNAGALPERCKYGKEQAIALDCRCAGCLEKMIYFYLDQAATKFGVPR